MRQTLDTVLCYHPLAIVTNKTHSYAKAIGEWNACSGPENASRHVIGKYLNNRIEGDLAVLKHRLTPMRGLHSLSSAKGTLTRSAGIANLTAPTCNGPQG